MKKILTVMLLTLSSLVIAANEERYEGVVNPNEMGVYIIDQVMGKVMFCQAVSDKKEMVTGCTDWSGVWGLAPNPLQQQFMNELLNQ
jgi:hypothetical protein